jgi:DNA-binding response OmpR family regulator
MRYRRLAAPNGAEMALTSLEFAFIKMFAMVETGEAISRKQIVQGFGEDYLSYDQNRIDTMVRRLRRKAESDLGTKLPLNTERVRGYSFGDLLIIDP